MGDFYEMFGTDAVEVSSLLGITLTKRAGVQMCGIPYHAYQNYVRRLLKAGKKIAICEQISLSEKGIAKREVVETISPGTVVDETYLESGDNNYLAVFCPLTDGYSLSYCDLSTGEFAALSFCGESAAHQLRHELARINAKEIILPESFSQEIRNTPQDSGLERYLSANIMINTQPDWCFDLQQGYIRLKEHFRVINLKGFNLREDDPAIISAGVMLSYLEENSRSLLPHLRSLKKITLSEYVGLDDATQRNLELVKNLRDDSPQYTLYHILNETQTKMGARLLKRWLLHPLRNLKVIQMRQKMVTLFYRHQTQLSETRTSLKKMFDGERLLAKVATDKANAKDLVNLQESLRAGLELSGTLLSWQKSSFLHYFSAPLCEVIERLFTLLEGALLKEPSLLLNEGGLIKEGYDAELDRLRGLSGNSRKILDDYLQEERSAAKINNLRLKYNRVIGYFFEITKSQLDSVPSHFIRRQTLVNSERYTTLRLGELQSEIESATTKQYELERRLFLLVREEVKRELSDLLTLFQSIAKIDLYQSLAYTATLRGYTLPRVHEGIETVISEGRHPVVEANLTRDEFVSNPLSFDTENFFALITGPNMAGKSTYLRQNALLILMAQIGSYIPAGKSSIGIVDQIFCRVGASDNLARGESTFLVEMNETAHILNSATQKSLIIMDEVGRGTGTNDGLSIAWAISEYILASVQARTLFATHFHELTKLVHPSLRNLSLRVKEEGGKIWFLNQVIDSPADSSYGVHVAALAGVPESVISRSNQLLQTLNLQSSNAKELAGVDVPPENTPSLFREEELISHELRHLEIDKMTPLEALTLLQRWQKTL